MSIKAKRENRLLKKENGILRTLLMDNGIEPPRSLLKPTQMPTQPDKTIESIETVILSGMHQEYSE